MIRNPKILGLALVAVFAMSSLVASAASATNDVFDADSTPATWTGTQHNGNGKFTLAGQSIECTTAKVNATVTKSPVPEITTEVPIYSGCTFGGAAVPVTMNGCRYNLTGTTDAGGDASVSIVDCNAGKSIELTLTGFGCTITIAEQKAEEGITLTDIGTGSTKELTLHLTIKTKVTSDKDPTEGIICASLTNATGTQCGTAIVTGEEDKATGAAHIGVQVTTGA